MIYTVSRAWPCSVSELKNETLSDLRARIAFMEVQQEDQEFERMKK